MKRPNKQLLDDLLEDSTSPEFRAALMDATLHSARLRRRVRSFRLALSAAALVGVFVFAFHEMREPVVSLDQIHLSFSSAAPAPSLNAVQVVSTKQDATLTVVQTSESDRPKEINDKELLALLADKPVALVRYPPNHAELISFDSNN